VFKKTIQLDEKQPVFEKFLNWRKTGKQIADLERLLTLHFTNTKIEKRQRNKTVNSVSFINQIGGTYLE